MWSSSGFGDDSLTRNRHKNSGPKFGIDLLPKQFVRPIQSLEDRLAPESEDLLHTPTPWHNCILRLENDPMLYLVKSGVVHQALEGKKFGGEWVTPEGDDGCQGHFHLRSNCKNEEANGNVRGKGPADKAENGSVYCTNEKIDIHLLKREGNRLKMLAGTSAGGKKTVAVTASAGNNVRAGDGNARSGTQPVQFLLQRAINRMFRIRLIRWLRSVFWTRAKIDG